MPNTEHLEYLRKNGVPCPHGKCSGYNMPHRKTCGKCRRRIKPSATMLKQGISVKLKGYGDE